MTDDELISVLVDTEAGLGPAEGYGPTIEAVRTLIAEQDRLRAAVIGAVLAIETVLMGDHVDMKMPATEVLGRTSASLKMALGGQLSMRPPQTAEEGT